MRNVVSLQLGFYFGAPTIAFIDGFPFYKQKRMCAKKTHSHSVMMGNIWTFSVFRKQISVKCFLEVNLYAALILAFSIF